MHGVHKISREDESKFLEVKEQIGSSDNSIYDLKEFHVGFFVNMCCINLYTSMIWIMDFIFLRVYVMQFQVKSQTSDHIYNATIGNVIGDRLQIKVDIMVIPTY